MTVQSPPDWAATLIDLLEQQRRIYEQLHALSEQQSRHVAGGEAEPLLDLLSQRQQLIDQLTQINGRIEPLKQDWPKRWAELDQTTQRQIQNLIDQVQGILDQIVEQDEKDRQSLSAQRDQVSSDLQQTNRGAAVNQAYGKPTTGARDPRFTDQQG